MTVRPTDARRRSRRAAKRRLLEWTNEVKLASGCVDCGYAGHPAALDFDHVRGEKRFSVATAVNEARSRKSIEEEIAKCDVRCANCHRIRHALEKEYLTR